MKYQVIVLLNESNGKRYYYSYVNEGGNIECDDLPPYQDINKARACYWNDEEWVFDKVRYEEILAEIEAAKEAARLEAERIAAIPNNEELRDMVLSTMQATNEVMMFIEEVVNPLNEMAALLTGGEE